MKNVEQQNIKKICNFYVSDLHLSVMLLPFISNEINEDVEVTTIFEENNKPNFEKILEKLNIKNKDKILNLNWYNNKNTEEEIKQGLNNNYEKNKNSTIIIGGSKKYIQEKNKIVIQSLNEKNNYNKNVKIINCYNVEDVAEEMQNIVPKYDLILNTSGERIHTNGEKFVG